MNVNKRKYNILMVVSDLHIGGAEQVIANLCRYIDRDLFNLSICHLKMRGVIGDELLNEGFDVIGTPEPKLIKVNYLSFILLRRVIRQKKIDIIHSHTFYSFIDSVFCRLSLLGIKHVHTYHFGNYPNYNKKYMMLEKLFWRIPDRLISVGNVQKRTIQETYKIPDNRILTAWNGVDEKAAIPDPQITGRFTDMNKVIVGSISTLIEQKGLMDLLDVAASLKKRCANFIFIVVGDGPLRKELELKRRSLGLEDTVFFLGWVQNADTTILPIFDIFIQTSHWEAMSMVLLEAMAAGKPIVTTNVGENRHIIDNGINGLIIEPKNTENMVAGIEKLISAPELRGAIGLEAKKKWNKQFTSNIMTKNYEDIYISVMTNNDRES